MAVNREEFLKVFDETTGNREQDQELLHSYQQDAKAFLPKLQNNNFPLYGLIGEYGTGKSTFLNAVKYYDQQDSDTNNIRITFEARKYPNRKELRDAFIIEILAKINIAVLDIDNDEIIKEEEDLLSYYADIKQKLEEGLQKDGSNDKEIKGILRDSLETISASTSFLDYVGLSGISGGIKFLSKLIGYTINDYKNDVSRLFDYEMFFEIYWKALLKDKLLGFDKVYIIIEDIDRCGDDGLVFLETLSYFVNTISKEEYMMDKMTCIVSIGQGFLNNNRHLINKAITSYEIFNMKTDSIKTYFIKCFEKSELGLSDLQKKSLFDFINIYLDTHGSLVRSIREVKYLFKKIIPEILEKRNNLEVSDDKIQEIENIMIGMILFNFSLFIRCNSDIVNGGNHGERIDPGIFDSSKGLYYSTPHKGYFYLPWKSIKIKRSFIGATNKYILNTFLFLFPEYIHYYRTSPQQNLNDIISYNGWELIDSKNIGIIAKRSSSSPDTLLCIESYRLLNE